MQSSHRPWRLFLDRNGKDKDHGSAGSCGPDQVSANGLQEPVESPSFALYSNSEGNYFFHEMRDLLAAGLEQIDARVQLRTERDGFADDVDYHVVIAPHEFFYLGAGIKLMEQDWPEKLVVVNTEQPSTEWFARARKCFERAIYIWDIDYVSVQRNLRSGYLCDYLPLGFVDTAELSQPVQKLPRHYGTCFLPPAERCEPCWHLPMVERPIDILFVGNPTPRREQFFAEAASVLAKYRCYFHFSDCSLPIVAGKNTHMNTTTVIGLAQRSKILLNIHRGRDCYFEWQRIVMQGIWQRTLVVSESSSVAPPFEPGRDYAEAPLPHLVDRLEYFLSSKDGLRQGQTIINQGYATLTENCRLPAFLQTLVKQLRPTSGVLNGLQDPAMANGNKNAGDMAKGETHERCA